MVENGLVAKRILVMNNVILIMTYVMAGFSQKENRFYTQSLTPARHAHVILTRI
jgi:hypothetical protein